uniref:Kinesin motor domain-containing protein n=1 Tax=Chromera velia CCMP2878 TaxID=1169474 RepID=A0A0G4GZS8_9ALVE|eukprot:Cvel_5467.t1-p1 / transcript=Cvel_5467.t1 / gene=Cvel_5467 / organism=Chromera_velia_CCMP2878 / gene_product=Kinesin-like calmodulin-binding protein, putative / transcript_product=Kinesin-like calmodulin-binding protein, putative / location=Cvel_scaffold255:101637-106754(-) / protein_length=106 / sequence_SO=supercontig / SO=protein_coding / is_pseudo=false
MMADCLGGSAKTFMFVNVSPADYNTDEMAHSLSFASRVKMITNNSGDVGALEALWGLWVSPLPLAARELMGALVEPAASAQAFAWSQTVCRQASPSDKSDQVPFIR